MSPLDGGGDSPSCMTQSMTETCPHGFIGMATRTTWRLHTHVCGKQERRKEMKVEYMAHSGNDLLVCNAARTSFGKTSGYVYLDQERARLAVMMQEMESEGKDFSKVRAYFDKLGEEESARWLEGDVDPKVLKYEDHNLINFLAREKHVLPFRHPTVTLRCKAPIFVARQLGKHQVGMSWSEESRRYIDNEPEFFWPDTWRMRADNVKQGSSNVEVSFDTKGWAKGVAEVALETYERLLEEGVAPEQARMILPQNMMVTWVWTGTLLSWHHMLQLRLAPDTQKETRDFANMVSDVITPLFPVSMEALREHD